MTPQRQAFKFDPVYEGPEAVDEGTQALISLYLALKAAQRYCDENGSPEPLGRPKLDDLASRLGQFRDAIMHWEDKKRRDTDALLAYRDSDVIASAPAGRNQPIRDTRVTWDEFDKAATRLDRWASGHLEAQSRT